MNRFFGHLKTITKHKLKVMHLCFKVGIYKRGLMHDLSKLSPVEFLAGVKYYRGYRSPIDREKEVLGYSKGWLHHKGHNRHHWEYWLDFTREKELKGMPMPKEFIAEMFCDRVAASMIYQKENYKDDSALNYYLGGKDYIIMHQKTQETIERWLTYLADHGLDETTKMIKNELKNEKRN